MRNRRLIVPLVLAAAALGCESGGPTAPPAPGNPGEVLYQTTVGSEYRLLAVTVGLAIAEESPGRSEPREVHRSAFEIRGAAWSADREQIVLSSFRSGEPRLWTLTKRGTQLRELTGEGETGEAPAWSPAGDRIAFHASRGGGDYEIWTVAADGSDPLQLTDNDTGDRFPDWSPAGDRIVFQSQRGSTSGSPDLWIMNADGSQPERLTFFADTDSASLAIHPAWSPDGEEIAFVGTSGEAFDLFVIGADGSGLRNLTNDPGTYGLPDWSPEGDRIVFMADPTGDDDIWSVAPDGSDPVNLTETPDRNETAPDW